MGGSTAKETGLRQQRRKPVCLPVVFGKFGDVFVFGMVGGQRTQALWDERGDVVVHRQAGGKAFVAVVRYVGFAF